MAILSGYHGDQPRVKSEPASWFPLPQKKKKELTPKMMVKPLIYIFISVAQSLKQKEGQKMLKKHNLSGIITVI